MRKTFIYSLVLFSLFCQAQEAKSKTYVTSSYYTQCLIKDGVVISVKAIPGEKSTDMATIYWQIQNTTAAPITLEGSFSVSGKPISGTFSNGTLAGKSKGSGTLPRSKVDKYSTQELEGSYDWINDVDYVEVTLDVIHKGDNIKSGSAN